LSNCLIICFPCLLFWLLLCLQLISNPIGIYLLIWFGLSKARII
jgi:hypothetical protein